MSSRAAICRRSCRSPAATCSQAARLAKRNRTDFYKLLSRHQLTPEDFKGR